MYSREVLTRFQDTSHVGELADASAYARVDNPACGDVMHLAIKVAGGRITLARFRTRGCVAAIACGALLTELIENRTLAQARALRREELVKALGGLPETSLHAAALAIDALATALKQVE